MACFCAATIGGWHLFLGNATRRHQRRLDKGTNEQVLDVVGNTRSLTVLLSAMETSQPWKRVIQRSDYTRVVFISLRASEEMWYPVTH